MHMRICLLLIAILVCIDMSAQRRYSKADTLRAKAYFDSSWNYSLGSAKHQLYLDSALRIMPTNAYYWQQKSMPLYKAGKYEVGSPFLDSAVKYDPEQWLEYRGFMKCIFEKNYKVALADLRKAKIKYGSKRAVMDHPYDFYIGLCHLQLNRPDSAEQYVTACIEDALKTRGEKWVHYNHLFYQGVIRFERENYRQAIESFDKTLALYPGFSDAEYYKALCLFELGQVQDAYALMRKANDDHRQGYSMNEDNCKYEFYPYQVRPAYFVSALEWMRSEANK
jgi:tetratricopeptide (TPR) repeat protein